VWIFGRNRLPPLARTLSICVVSLGTGGTFVLGVSGWRLLSGDHAAAFTRSAKLGAGVALVCTVLVIVTGDIQARLMVIDVVLMYLAARRGLGAGEGPPGQPGAPGEQTAQELVYFGGRP
jgi:cytochrome bd-type quinol oxidase subunit 1